MADEEGCECVWSHEYAMQRLINFIRQNQNVCTDTECFDGNAGGRGSQVSENNGSGFTIAMVFMILAMFMYVFNPSTWGKWSNANKPNRHDNNHQGGSPPPPQPPPPPTAT
ncbi:small integral membrane protein 14 isoform X1 [Drosophila tropicalis]|uniref:small integral membrane protein 14 isoform X1 n=1 Tax=Drosophila tropicalis TaxID=46794 RepID=UPI0035AB81C6